MKTAAVVAVVLAVLFLFLRSRSDIGDADAKELVAKGASLIDVRSPGEYADGHAPGAKNIPVDEIAARLAEIPRDKPVLVYCRSGMRSGRAAGILKDAGYENIHNIGAMPRW